jgi:hypothetical protein
MMQAPPPPQSPPSSAAQLAPASNAQQRRGAVLTGNAGAPFAPSRQQMLHIPAPQAGCCCPGKNDYSPKNYILPQASRCCCPESGCCTCTDWCCPWVNHTKIAEYVGHDEESRWCISTCIACAPCRPCANVICSAPLYVVMPCAAFITAPLCVLSGCACGPDCHGLYHGSTASIWLREHAGLEVRQCDLICFSTFCPSCALTHDRNIMDALIRAGVPPKKSKRQLMIVDHMDFQDLFGAAKRANQRQGPPRAQML